MSIDPAEAPQEVLLQWILEALSKQGIWLRRAFLSYLVDRAAPDYDRYYRWSTETLQAIIEAGLQELVHRKFIDADDETVALTPSGFEQIEFFEARRRHSHVRPRRDDDLLSYHYLESTGFEEALGAGFAASEDSIRAAPTEDSASAAPTEVSVSSALAEDTVMAARTEISVSSAPASAAAAEDSVSASPTDLETAIERMSTLEADAPISPRLGRVAFSLSPARQDVGAPGKLAENIPRLMRVHVPEQAEIRISRADSAILIAAMKGHGEVHIREIPTAEAMSLRLTAPSGGFVIDSHSSETQWVHSEGESDIEVAAWRFTITPTRRGSGLLRISLAYRRIGSNGLLADRSLPGETIDVRVSTNVRRTCMGATGWTVSMLVGAALGAYFSDIVRWIGLILTRGAS